MSSRPRLRIGVRALCRSKDTTQVRLVREAVRRTLRREGWNRPASLDVVLVEDEEIRRVNAMRRGIDEATDVLSFPLVQLEPGASVAEDSFVLPPDEALHLGDILVSLDRVRVQAEAFGHSPARELAYLTVHGVLHILGYGHETAAEQRQMREHEEAVLAEMGLSRGEP